MFGNYHQKLDTTCTMSLKLKIGCVTFQLDQRGNGERTQCQLA